MNEWLVFSLILLGIWFLIFIFRKGLRNEMFLVSLFTMPFGLTEPFFVPEYWNPPSLFNLASKTGFDIESLIFTFAIGGIASVIYEVVFKVKHEKIKRYIRKKHKFYLWVLFSPFIVFLPLYVFTNLNPIYSASIAMIMGGIAIIFCRPDLLKKILLGGVLFLGLYFSFFFFFNLIYPNFIKEVWNLSAISGILILGVPLEELMFAFTFGMLWSGFYEHINWYRLKEVRKKK
jgi:hypothetical protein